MSLLTRRQSLGKVGKPIYILLFSTFLLIIAFLFANTSFAFTRGITEEYIQEIKDRFQGNSDSESAPEIFLSENEPYLLAKQKVEEKLLQKAERSNASVASYIDTGFSRKSDILSFESDRISDIKIYFYVHNDSDNKERLTVNTGIKKGTLKYIRLKGATGYRWEDDELVIAYVPLAAQKSTTVTLTAIPLISHKPVPIQVKPVIRNKKGNVVGRGNSEDKTMQLKPSVDINRISNVKRAN